MRILFQHDFRGEEFSEDIFKDFHVQLEELEETPGPRELRKIQEFSEATVKGVIENLDSIDDTITKYAHHWRLDRMTAVDRNVMRIAVYELQYLNEVPPVVSINEAVEIAKLYGTEDSGKFVNGILDNVNKGLSE